ncbi:hypothetical protein DL96DRAFT_1588020 [Flagelloscypha sp. PMI_526]|nr:hypothetical protein DL96DRAFT_1588020 [Flagelloscypha sp. PMI_526]
MFIRTCSFSLLMKLIVTGATGRIGSSVVRYCVDSPTITSVVVLSRRALPYENEFSPAQLSKLKTLILTREDFLNYPPRILSELEGADGCVWAMGSVFTPTQEVDVDYPVNAAKAFKERLMPPLKAQGKKFRYVFVSGQLVSESWATDNLWFMAEGRKTKAGGLHYTLKLDDGDAFNSYGVMTSACVMPNSLLDNRIGLSLPRTIRSVDLASALTKIATGKVTPSSRTVVHSEFRKFVD